MDREEAIEIHKLLLDIAEAYERAEVAIGEFDRDERCIRKSAWRRERGAPPRAASGDVQNVPGSATAQQRASSHYQHAS